jgi:hypothetical protein
MKLTRKQVEKIIEKKYRKWNGSRIRYLCDGLDFELDIAWLFAWQEINKGEKMYVTGYFDENWCDTEAAFLRLLTLHLWVRHDFKD